MSIGGIFADEEEEQQKRSSQRLCGVVLWEWGWVRRVLDWGSVVCSPFRHTRGRRALPKMPGYANKDLQNKSFWTLQRKNAACAVVCCRR